MQAPTNILLALARLHAAAHNLRDVLETERDNAHTEYRMCIVFSGGKISDDAALRIGIALERENRALKAIRELSERAFPLHYTTPESTTMQAPTEILFAIARLHAAAHDLRTALETERDNAQTDYERLAALPGGLGNDHTAMLLQLADERGYHARRALRNAFGGFVGQVVTPQPEDLGYDAVKVIA